VKPIKILAECLNQAEAYSMNETFATIATNNDRLIAQRTLENEFDMNERFQYNRLFAMYNMTKFNMMVRR